MTKGTAYDYGNPGSEGDFRTRIRNLRQSTRTNAKGFLNDGSSLKGGVTRGRLRDLGVGSVRNYLKNAYNPFIPGGSQSTTKDIGTYADFMGGRDFNERLSNLQSGIRNSYEISLQILGKILMLY